MANPHKPTSDDEPNLFQQALLGAVLEAVSEVYGVAIEDITGRLRMPRYTEPRHVAMYLSQRVTRKMSNRCIAWAFNRTVCAVTHGERVVKDQKDLYPEFRARLEQCAIALGRRLADAVTSLENPVTGD